VSLDTDTLGLAERIIGLYRGSEGKRKGELLDRLREVEEMGLDYKLVRGLSVLLERECTFEAESAFDPTLARMAVFEEASRVRAAATKEETDAVLLKVASELGIDQGALTKTLYSDIEEELVVKEFRKPPPSPEHLLKRYNLSLTQTLLFKALRVEFIASGNWKNIFRDVKRFGLIYSVEKNDDSTYLVSLDGPLSLFKFTDRYGTSVAKLLPQITAAETWKIKAEILARRKGNRVYTFEAESEEFGAFLREPSLAEIGATAGRGVSPFDSSVEERFARAFVSHGTGWTLKRETELLVAGRHVLIPDFSFEKYGRKVYLEIVGFWTPGYLERKVDKLRTASAQVDIVIAADESLACAKLERLKEGRAALVFYYKREVPVKPVIEYLRRVEASVLRKQAEGFRPESVKLEGDVVSLESIAKQAGGLPVESVRTAMLSFDADGYVRAGDLFISKRKLDDLGRKLEGMERLTDALKAITESGFREEDGEKVLNAAGYASIWEGMDVADAKISKLPLSQPKD
jgi:predicted nuclease of restriction endonuclease-like RecB superfamily